MPEIETIIKESLKIKLNNERLDTLARQFSVLKSPRPSDRMSLVKVEVIN